MHRLTQVAKELLILLLVAPVLMQMILVVAGDVIEAVLAWLLAALLLAGLLAAIAAGLSQWRRLPKARRRQPQHPRPPGGVKPVRRPREMRRNERT